MRIAVVGGLAAGPAAAAEAHRQSPDAEVVLYEEGRDVSVGVCEIPAYVAGRLEGADSLRVYSAERLEASKGFEVRLRHRVTGLDPRRGTLTVDALDYGSTHEVRADRVILATGARPRRLGVDGEQAAGVFTIRDLADAVDVERWLETEDVRHAVVVGGGYIGLEMAEALRERGVRATILEPRGRVLGQTIACEASDIMDRAVRAAGVLVRPERATEILTDGERVCAVRTDRSEIIGCQMVVVAIGVEPNVGLAAAAGAAVGATGALRVDDRMRTSLRNVWACGDLVEVPHCVDGRPMHWPLATVARRTARVAARNAAHRGGAADRFQPVAGAVAVRAFGVEAASAGFSLADARDAGFDAVATDVRARTRPKTYPGSCPIDVRLVVERGTGRLLGGQLVSEEGAALRVNVLVPLICDGASAGRLAEDLDLVYNPPVAPAVDPLKVAAREAMKAAGRASRRR